MTGPLTDRIVQRLGKRSPLLYIQSNGWEMESDGQRTISWGHEQYVRDALGRVNLALQALGTTGIIHPQPPADVAMKAPMPTDLLIVIRTGIMMIPNGTPHHPKSRQSARIAFQRNRNLSHSMSHREVQVPILEWKF